MPSSAYMSTVYEAVCLAGMLHLTPGVLHLEPAVTAYLELRVFR